MYKIDYLYFAYPLILIFSLFTSKKFFLEKLLVVMFLFFLGFSYVGADLSSYELFYKLFQNGMDIRHVHGEILFKKYMLFFVNLGISYEYFRSVHILLFSSIVIYVLKKINSNKKFILGLYILYCGYIIYIVSAYRQLVSIAFLFLGVYLLKNNKINKAIVLNFLGIFFHSSSVWSFIMFIILKLFYNKEFKVNKKKIIFIIIVAFIMRLFSPKLMKVLILISNILGKSTSYLSEVDILPFGLITRIIPLIIVVLLYKNSNKFYNSIFIFYVMSIILYIILPFDLLMGRLTNNGRILECIILPFIYSRQKNRFNKNFVMIFIILYWALVLINQLFKQGGYYPYQNIVVINCSCNSDGY